MRDLVDQVFALRWHLPVRTPSDHRTEQSGDQLSINAGWDLAGSAPLERPPVVHAFEGPAGENSDPLAAPVTGYFPSGSGTISIPLIEAEGRQAVSEAMKPH